MKQLLTLFMMVAFPLSAVERPSFYPFDVKLGGIRAQVKKGNAFFAEVPVPVAADAVLALEKAVPVLWVSIVRCLEDGTVEMSVPAALIQGKDTREVKLDATVDKNKLTPGMYLASVEGDTEAGAAAGAEESGATIAFVVAKPGAKPTVVDFSKVLGFLKKQAAGQ